MTQTFLMSEAQNRPGYTDRTREQISRRIQRAFIEIDRAAQSGQKDRAASAANFAGQDIDEMFRALAMNILGGTK